MDIKNRITGEVYFVTDIVWIGWIFLHVQLYILIEKYTSISIQKYTNLID